MPRKRQIPDQFTASLQLKCGKTECGHEFSEEVVGRKSGRPIYCPHCGSIVAANDEEIFRLRSEQTKRITEAIEELKKAN